MIIFHYPQVTYNPDSEKVIKIASLGFQHVVIRCSVNGYLQDLNITGLDANMP